MARFVHIADARTAAAIRRGGLKAAQSWHGPPGVFCVPVVPDHARTFQWARELRRSSAVGVAVFFVVDDDEPVLVGRYNGDLAETTAARAHAFFRSSEDPYGYEVIVPRSVTPGEIRSMRPAPRLTGWRYQPGSNGKGPYWPYPGTFNARNRRRRYEDWLERDTD
ncbi:MAG: hypothetical protein QM608_16970 [Caulobacter sp.]